VTPLASAPTPSVPRRRPSREAEEQAARLERVATILVSITRQGAGRKLLLPVMDCVRELRTVWTALRQRDGANAAPATWAPLPAEPDSPPDPGAPAGGIRRPRPPATACRSQSLVEAAPPGLPAPHRQTLRDCLTRVLNRSAFMQRLTELASQTPALTGIWCVAIADLDRLSEFNRHHGARLGDALLFRVAEKIQRTCETYPGAAVARVGGEEFGILFPHASLREARRMAEEARLAVAGAAWEFLREGAPTRVRATVSLGVAEYRRGESAEDVIRRALRRLEEAKQAGRNIVVAEGGPGRPTAGRASSSTAPLAAVPGT